MAEWNLSDSNISALRRRLRRQILWGLTLMTVVASFGWVWRTVTIRNDIAQLLAKSIEHDLQAGDFRGAIISLDRAGASFFHKVVLLESGNSERFIVGQGSNEFAPFSSRVNVKSSNSDEGNSYLIFYYNPLEGLTLFLLIVLPILGSAGFFEFRRSINRISRDIQNYGLMKSTEAKERLASQVAHDIRSPLAALEMVIKEAATFPEEQRILVRSATSRIRDIANDLLKAENAAKRGAQASTPTPQLLSALIELIITEKRMQYRAMTKIEIDAKISSDSYGLFASVVPSEFKRVISNLVNNAIESMNTGRVMVSLQSSEQEVQVKVEDSGKGIPPGLLERLGREKLSLGKEGTESGSGLGLYHARQCLDAWGGKLEIQSELGKGSAFTLRIPLAVQPDWFTAEISLGKDVRPVVIDDDPSVLRVWETRFSSAGARSFLHFFSADSFTSWYLNEAQRGNCFFLFDYELLGSDKTGLDLIEQYGLAKTSILVTSRFEEKEIRDRAKPIGVKVLPKGLAAFVPISVSGSKNLDAVLVDDDDMIRATWEFAAKTMSKQLLCFSTSTDLFSGLSEIDKNTTIYIDSGLEGEELKGEDVAKRLYERGYQNLFLATGYSASHFPKMPWIRGIVGKEAPWL